MGIPVPRGTRRHRCVETPVCGQTTGGSRSDWCQGAGVPPRVRQKNQSVKSKSNYRKCYRYLFVHVPRLIQTILFWWLWKTFMIYQTFNSYLFFNYIHQTVQNVQITHMNKPTAINLNQWVISTVGNIMNLSIFQRLITCVTLR